MPKRDTSPAGAPCWVDLMTSDAEGATTFYTQLFGWEAEPPAEEHGGYINFTKDGVRIAGCMGSEPGQEQTNFWSTYLCTDDAAKTVETAKANGGQVYLEPMVVGDIGTMAMVGDRDGAAIGVWQPGTHKGFGIVTESGAPSWFELWARDYDGAVDFYRSVFNWNTQVASDTPELHYTIVVDGDDQQAGVMDASGFLPEGAPAHWSVYFGVDDADAALAKVVELGGSVVQPAEDTPYGRLATAADPSGARFRLIAPNEAMPAKPQE